MLNTYIQRTMRYLRQERQETINPQDLIDYVNEARGQIAAEGECIRQTGSITITSAVPSYAFSSIALPASAVFGMDGVIHVRSLRYASGSGFQWVPPRPWEWFELYGLNNTAPVNGAPTMWTQYGQGAAPGDLGITGGGSFWVSPTPNASYTVVLDCVCYPTALVNDATVEALPYLWTDAVPFLASYFALMVTQTLTSSDQASRMYDSYKEFMRRARAAANPAVGRYQYQQADDPRIINKLQVRLPASGGG
jgi:hypothetical protein